jgi:tetratricopeptide (TPR) repeat protein
MHAWLNEGASLYMLSRFEEAIERFDGAIELDPLHGKAYLMKGRCLKALGFPEEASEYFLKAEELGERVEI